MTIIYKQDIDFNTIADYYFKVDNLISSQSEKINLLISMKRINNIYKSIKLRICELKREKIIGENYFFEENRRFILNRLNEDHPHFTFSEFGIKSLKNINDDILASLINKYTNLLNSIYDEYGTVENVLYK